MENVRNRIDVRLISDADKYEKLVSKPLFNGATIINDVEGEEMTAVQMIQAKIKLNKPIAVGFSVLELSKVFMYDFYYNTLVEKYGDKVKMLITDTDSMILEVQTEDLYKDIEKMSDKFDLSNFPKDHFLYDGVNNKVVGKMKSETADRPIAEVCGIRSKMYSLKYEDDNKMKEKKTAKGVKKSYIDRDIKHADYKRCLFMGVEDMKQSATFNLIRSVNHSISSVTVTKSSLVAYDDKVYLLDSINSLPYGHYKINK